MWASKEQVFCWNSLYLGHCQKVLLTLGELILPENIFTDQPKGQRRLAIIPTVNVKCTEHIENKLKCIYLNEIGSTAYSVKSKAKELRDYYKWNNWRSPRNRNILKVIARQFFFERMPCSLLLDSWYSSFVIDRMY